MTNYKQCKALLSHPHKAIQTTIIMVKIFMYTYQKEGLFTFSETCVEPVVTIYCGCLGRQLKAGFRKTGRVKQSRLLLQ